MEKIVQLLAQLGKIAEIPFKIILFIVIASGILFFLPSSVRDYLLMTDFYKNVGPYLGPIFIISLLYVIFVFICRAVVFFSAKIDKRKRLKTKKERLNDLSIKEIVVLREFFFQQSDVITATMEDEGVASLLAKEIITVIQKQVIVYTFGTPVKVQIDSSVKRCCSPELLCMSPNPTKADWKRYLSERPAFVSSIQGFQNLQNSIFNPIPNNLRR